jgi:Cytochrome b562
MKFKSLLTLALTLAVGFTSALAAEDDTPLMKEMKTMNKSLRALKKQVADASKKDDSLALIATIKKSLEASMKLEPVKTKEVPAAEKAAYLDKYKAQMTDLAKTYDELEAAIKADKADDVKKALDKLSDQKEKGHKDFAPDEK